MQTEGPERSLVESWGPLEFQFRLEPREGALYYHQQACGLRMGRIRISLPAWASPQVSAREGPTTSANQCIVSVVVVAPLAGSILDYEAEVEILVTLRHETRALATGNPRSHRGIRYLLLP
jgi:hypothetical protein